MLALPNYLKMSSDQEVMACGGSEDSDVGDSASVVAAKMGSGRPRARRINITYKEHCSSSWHKHQKLCFLGKEQCSNCLGSTLESRFYPVLVGLR